MPDSPLATMTPEAVKKVEDSLTKMRKVLDNRIALVESGFITQDDVNQVQITYDATKKLFDLFKPKKP